MSVPRLLLATLCGSFVLALAPAAWACGPITHAAVAARLAGYVDPTNPPGYQDFLQRNPGPHDTGAIALDVFFSFGDEVGHAAHSRTYLDAFRDLMLQDMDLPLDAEEERTLVFYLGQLSHYIADYHWHGYDGDPDAFIWEAMEQDGVLEETAELGVDIYMLWEQGERNAEALWWYPGDLMVEAIHAIGYPDISLLDLDLAMAALESGYRVERLTGYFSYLWWRSYLPWTHENYGPYTPGGLIECVTYGVTETEAEIDLLAGELK